MDCTFFCWLVVVYATSSPDPQLVLHVRNEHECHQLTDWLNQKDVSARYECELEIHNHEESNNVR